MIEQHDIHQKHLRSTVFLGGLILQPEANPHEEGLPEKRRRRRSKKDEPNKVIINPSEQDVFSAFSFGAKFHGVQQVSFKVFITHIPLQSLKSLIDEVKSGKENFHVKVEKMVRCHPEVANFIAVRNYMNSMMDKIDNLLMNATASATTAMRMSETA